MEIIKTSFGNFLLSTENGYLNSLKITNEKESKELSPLAKKLRLELEEYFSHKRKKFTIPLRPNGTEFQKAVWNELLKIDYGNTTTYSEIAKRIGNENASRAVGGANNKNPIIILIPCHRVIGKNNSLVGYSEGLDIKRKLLEIEKK